MFVPYHGKSKRFDTAVTFSAQRRFTSQKIHKEKREKAIKLKALLDSQNLPSPPNSLSDTTEVQSDQPDQPDQPSQSYQSPSSSPPHRHNPSTLPISDSSLIVTRQDAQSTSSSALVCLQNATRLAYEAQPDDTSTFSATTTIAFNDMVFGGLRVDPFANYPIPPQSYFPYIVDFCKEVVALGPIYLQFILSHDILFEAIVTYVLCVHPQQTPETNIAMMHHYGSTLSKVRLSLSMPNRRTRDDVILAVANLAVICAYRGDDKRFDTHLRGVRRLVEMRRGLDGPEKEDSWIKSCVTALEALAGAHSQKAGVSDISASPPPKITLPGDTRNHKTKPIYPKHPFPPDLCTVIARMPVGFRELALTGHLSIQLMTRLNITRSEIVHLMATAPSDDKDKEWQTLMRASSSIERMAWLTVLVFHLRSSTYISDCKELAEVALECAEIGAKSQAQSEWLLWAACLMIATPDCEKVLGKHRDRVAAMVLQNYNHLTVDQMNSNAERFLWSEGLSASLEVHIRNARRKTWPALQG